MSPQGHRRSALVARLVMLGAATFAGNACGFDERQATQAVLHAERIVYDQDDRVDIYEANDAAMAQLARSNVAAIVSQNQAVIRPDGSVTLREIARSEAVPLCPGQRFAGQPIVARCSGVLVQHDLLLTAGHCLGDPSESTIRCREMLVVFNYAQSLGPQLDTITRDDVYACAAVLQHQYLADSIEVPDFALIKLDRPVGANRAPARVGPAPSEGDILTLIGHGAGLPMKIAPGAVVTKEAGHGHFFAARSDSFTAGSGSGLFDSDGRLVGLQSRGQADFLLADDASCVRARTTTEGEELHQLASGACAADDLAFGACGTSGACGDRACGAHETSLSCRDDCPPLSCGDAICAPAERTSCPADCDYLNRLPMQWACAPHRFGDGEVCNCECGAHDPDCTGASYAEGCGWFEVCSSSGTCTPVRSGSDEPPSARRSGASCSIPLGTKGIASGDIVLTGLVLMAFSRRAKRRRERSRTQPT